MAETYNSKGQTDLAYLGLMALFILFVGGWLLWWAFHSDLVYWSTWLDWHILGGLAWIWSPPWLTRLRSALANAASYAPEVSPSQLWAILDRGGLVFLPVMLGLLLLLGLSMRKHPSNHVRRAISPDVLRWIMARHAPAIIPTLYYPNLLENDPPEFRSFDTPEEWALRHHLVVNQRLDRGRTKALLISELGRRISTPYDLEPHERALFAVFGARLLSNGEDISAAQQLLDKLNFSCHTGTWQGRKGFPDLALAEPYFEKYAAHPDAKEWLAAHGYSRTLLHAMHQEAIQKGKVPSSHFIWLMPMDRGLYVALNTSGRKVPFVESLAVFTQTRWEAFARTLGLQLTQPHLDDAVDALNSYLEKVGLVAPSAKGKDV